MSSKLYEILSGEFVCALVEMFTQFNSLHFLVVFKVKVF